MTDRTDHRDTAERMLADSHEWGRQAEEPTPEVGELSCLAYAAVHALLAVHDTLTAADRYAANEAKQREEADMDEVLALGRKAGKRWSRTLDLLKQAEAEEREEAAGPDPLDEDDHRDRVDRDGYIWIRNTSGYWHSHTHQSCVDPDCKWTLAYLNECYGPLTFAPDTAQDATRGDLSASEGESGAEEGPDTDNAPEPLLCPECGEGIFDHSSWDDDARFQLRCRLTVNEVARALIEQAVKQAGGGRG